MAKFNWVKKERGESIEKFVKTLATNHPDLAKKILERGIKGDFKFWLQDGTGEATVHLDVAECGCLVGTTIMAAYLPVPDKKDWHNTDIHALVQRFAKQHVDMGDISLVGNLLADEVLEGTWDVDYYDTYEEYEKAQNERNREVASYITRLFKTELNIS
jgi:hypothetical protein